MTPDTGTATALRVAAAAVLATGALSVADGALTTGQHDVLAVVLVDALTAAVFGAGLALMARLVARRTSGAALGALVLVVLCVPYLLGRLAVQLPGVSLQVTLPGDNVLNSANLDVALRGVRPAWHDGADITLTVLAVAVLAVALVLVLRLAAVPPGEDRPHPAG